MKLDGVFHEDVGQELHEVDHEWHGYLAMGNYPADLDPIPEEEQAEFSASAPPEEPPDQEGDELEVPTREQQATLLRMHINLGHPKVKEFAGALKLGKCRLGVVQWVLKYFKCGECERQRLKGVRPAALPRS